MCDFPAGIEFQPFEFQSLFDSAGWVAGRASTIDPVNSQVFLFHGIGNHYHQPKHMETVSVTLLRMLVSSLQHQYAGYCQQSMRPVKLCSKNAPALLLGLIYAIDSCIFIIINHYDNSLSLISAASHLYLCRVRTPVSLPETRIKS